MRVGVHSIRSITVPRVFTRGPRVRPAIYPTRFVRASGQNEAGEILGRIATALGETTDLAARKQKAWGTLVRFEKDLGRMRMRHDDLVINSRLVALMKGENDLGAFVANEIKGIYGRFGFQEYASRIDQLMPGGNPRHKIQPRDLGIFRPEDHGQRRPYEIVTTPDLQLTIRELLIDGFEKVLLAQGNNTGFRAMIALHDLTQGPAVGGIRMWNYPSEEAALTDVKRLSRGMTHKSAVSRNGLGGGKSIIIGDPESQKTPQWLAQMGLFIDHLGGYYYGAEDVNIGVDDLVKMYKQLRKSRQGPVFLAGLPVEMGSSGNPSPFTARGMIEGTRAALRHRFGGNDRLSDYVFAFQGVGQVGGFGADILLQEGAKGLILADTKRENMARFSSDPRVTILENPKAIYDARADVFLPCALGGVLNDNTIPRLQAKVVSGAGNNLLLVEDRHARMLAEKQILYVPDFVINCGGIDNIGVELGPGGYNEGAARKRALAIGQSVSRVLQTARDQEILPQQAATKVADAYLTRIHTEEIPI